MWKKVCLPWEWWLVEMCLCEDWLMAVRSGHQELVVQEPQWKVWDLKER